jgi:superfamily II DNA or RNA helicase
MEIFISNTYSILKTDNTKLLKALGKKYRCKAPGAEYASSYKRGHWDGYTYYFNPKTGKFGTGLLYSILEDLDYLEYDYKVTDSRPSIEIGDSEIEGIEPRDYQESLIQEALELKSCIIKSPTGSGKTIIIAAILKALEGKTGLLFFNKKQLLKQTSDFLTKCGIEHGLAFGDGVDIKPLTLVTIQSIDKVIDTHLKTSEFIMFDEIHEFAKGKVAKKVLSSFPTATYRIGLSATPPKDRHSQLTLTSFLGKQIEYVTAKDLVEEGYLTLPSIQLLELPDIDDSETTGKTYQEIYEEFIVDYKHRNELIVSIVSKITDDNAKILILTKNLAHAKYFKDNIPDSYQLEGKDSLQDRDKTLQKFLEKDGPSVIIGTIIFQTGIDIPELTHLVNARGLKSEIATVQALGRTLRKHKNKSQVYIYDFIDKAPYLGKHSKLRVDAYKSLDFNIEFHGIKKK